MDSTEVYVDFVVVSEKSLISLIRNENFPWFGFGIHLRVTFASYEFQLLLRGSRDGFALKTLHEMCDSKAPTVLIIKVKDSNEILRGMIRSNGI